MTVFHDKAPTVPSLSAPIQMYQRKHPVLPPHVVVASSAVAEKEEPGRGLTLLPFRVKVEEDRTIMEILFPRREFITVCKRASSLISTEPFKAL